MTLRKEEHLIRKNVTNKYKMKLSLVDFDDNTPISEIDTQITISHEALEFIISRDNTAGIEVLRAVRDEFREFTNSEDFTFQLINLLLLAGKTEN